MDFKPFKIGKFLLLERLATGGMAEVYRAKASGAGGFEKQLAVKRIIPTYSENEEFRRMFEYEARLSSMLTHPNIVQVYDFVKSADTYLLSMEYVDGKNLRQVLNKAKKMNIVIPLEIAVYIINETCKGLDYAHSKKDEFNNRPLTIIHRDMSPQNIMLSYDGMIKIVDFGIAKAKDRVDETRSGVIKGKFGYMSPEQASGDQIDHRSDIFSTGIILYELITNKRLFASENDMATLKRIQECIVQRPSLVNGRVNQELEKISLKALAKDPNIRFQTAGQMQKKLQEYLNRHFPSLVQQDMAEVLQNIFSQEIDQEKKRLEQVYRQSIPFSQGAKHDEPEMLSIEKVLEGESTQSDHHEESLITSAGESQASQLSQENISHGAGSSEKTVVSATFNDFEDPSDSVEAATPISELDGPQEDSSHIVELDSEAVSVENSAPDQTLTPSHTFGSLEMPHDNQPSVNPGSQSVPTEPRANTASATIAATEASSPSIGLLEKSLTSKSKGGQSISHTPLQPLANKSAGSISITKTPVSRSVAKRPLPKKEEAPVSVPEVDRVAPPDPKAIQQRHSGTRVMDDEGEPAEEVSFVTNVDRGSNPNPSPNSDFSPMDYNQIMESDMTSSQSSNLVIDAPEYTHSSHQQTTHSHSKIAYGQIFIMLLLFAFTIGGGTYLYKSAFENPERPLAGENSETTPEAETSSDAELDRKVNAVPKNPSTCLLKVDSDPRGATITVAGKNTGLATPNTVSVPCSATPNVQLELKDHEPTRQQVRIDGKDKNFYATLTPIPQGVIEFTLSHNAVVYINGTKELVAKSREPFKIRLKADQPHTIRFENPAWSINESRVYSVKKGSVIEERINLDSRKN